MRITCAEKLDRWECLKRTQIRRDMALTCNTRERGEFMPDKEIDLVLVVDGVTSLLLNDMVATSLLK